MNGNLESGIYEKLKSFADGKVYQYRAPQGASGLFVVYQRLSSSRWRSINAPSGMAQATMQIDVYGEDASGVQKISAEIENTLDGLRQTVYYGLGSPQDYVRIGGVSLQSDTSTIDRTDEPFLYRNSADYLITYER